MSLNLKKSDKLIAVIGVIILIVAAIGVALYTSTEEADEISPFNQKKTYLYFWSLSTGHGSIQGSVNKKILTNISLPVKSPSGSVLTKVEIRLDWEDDNIYGIFRKKGEDVLTAEVSHLGGGSQDDESTGSDNMTFVFTVNDIPEGNSVEAKTKPEADQKIEENHSGMNDASFEIKVDIETGERIWRPLQFIRDTGNDFDVRITYTYYVFSIEESEGGTKSNEGSSTGLNGDDIYTGAIGNFYRNLCWGRGVI